MSDETKCCGTCGLLGLRPTAGGPLHEMSVDARNTGKFDRGQYRHGPACVYGKVNLAQECANYVRQQYPGGGTDKFAAEAIRHVLATNRNCDKWEEHIPSLTPDEHVKMTWQESAIDAQAKSALALQAIAQLQEKFVDLKRDQLDRDQKTNERLTHIEGRRHFQSVFWNAFSAIIAGLTSAWLMWYLTRPT